MSFWLRVVVGWLVNAAAIWVAVKLFDGVRADSWKWILVAAAVFGIVNAFVKPVLVIVAIPAIVLTLGLALFLINMAMLGLTDWIVSGFDVAGFWTYVGATITIWIVNVALETVFERR